MQFSKKLFSLAALATAVSLIAPAVIAAEFPGDRPIILIVPFAAGGPTDKVAHCCFGITVAVYQYGDVVWSNGAGGTIG